MKRKKPRTRPLLLFKDVSPSGKGRGEEREKQRVKETTKIME